MPDSESWMANGGMALVVGTAATWIYTVRLLDGPADTDKIVILRSTTFDVFK